MKTLPFILMLLGFMYSACGRTKDINSDIQVNLAAIYFDCNACISADSTVFFDPREMFIDVDIVNNSADTLIFGAHNLEYYSMEKLKCGYFEMILPDGDTLGLYATYDYCELLPGNYLTVTSRYEDRDGSDIMKRFSLFDTDSDKEKLKKMLQGCQIVYTPIPEDYAKNSYTFISSPRIADNENFIINYLGWTKEARNPINVEIMVAVIYCKDHPLHHLPRL